MVTANLRYSAESWCVSIGVVHGQVWLLAARCKLAHICACATGPLPTVMYSPLHVCIQPTSC
jgi:hypothetical protein